MEDTGRAPCIAVGHDSEDLKASVEPVCATRTPGGLEAAGRGLHTEGELQDSLPGRKGNEAMAAYLLPASRRPEGRGPPEA